jgi:hypothetical protein
MIFGKSSQKKRKKEKGYNIAKADMLNHLDSNLVIIRVSAPLGFVDELKIMIYIVLGCYKSSFIPGE